MALSVTEAAVIAAAAFCLWRLVAFFILPSALSNIPGPEKASWWKGNFSQYFNRFGMDFHLGLFRKYGTVVKLNMLFGDEQLVVSDPLALHHIVVKDQYIYEETAHFIATNALFLGTGLLSTLGDHHKKQRKMLNPVFSLKHMRGLITVFNPITHQLQDVLTEQMKRAEGGDVDVMKWLSRAALEYIGQGGLGYAFNALDDSKKDTYSETLKEFGPANFSLFILRPLLPYIVQIGSPSFRRTLLELLPWRTPQRIKEIVDMLHGISQDIYRTKVDALQKGDEYVSHQVGQGKDIMSVLLRANSVASESEKLPEEEVFGQMNGFIMAAHETTTSALCRILDLLVHLPDVQSRLREEIVAARAEAGGDLDYDTLMGLPYLDAICRETLRVFPPINSLQRTTRKDIVLPLLWPITGKDGKIIKEIPLKKNTTINIGVIGANRNKAIWGEDAEEWKPDRWLQPLPDTVAKAHLPGVYASMMTFLGGGRACIGFKFAEMEMKLVLTQLLNKFVFERGLKEIEWTIGGPGVARPVLKSSGSSHSQLPLKISLVQA